MEVQSTISERMSGDLWTEFQEEGIEKIKAETGKCLTHEEQQGGQCDE